MNYAVKFMLPLFFVALISPLSAAAACIPQYYNETIQSIETCIPTPYSGMASRIVDRIAGQQDITPAIGRDIVDR